MFKEYLAYLKDNPEKYWFKAKLFGWGWTPARWQGWVTLLAFLVLLFANVFLNGKNLDAQDASPTKFLVITGLLVAVLIAICYKTGERPRWQWGIPEKYKK